MTNISSVKKFTSEAFSQIFHVLGLFWLIVEPGVFVIGADNAVVIRRYWWLILIIGVAIAMHRLRPTRKHSFKVSNRDTNVELVIGDIFKQDGDIVVGSNTSFVTSPDVISDKSIQGGFSSKYFNGVGAINDQIRGQIRAVGDHPFGTTVSVRTKERVGYFCAIATINESGIANSSIENLRIALGALWSYIADNAEKDTLNVPILGSGFSRIGLPREELFRQIVRSFMAAISDRTFCDTLRIVVHPADVKMHSIDVDGMARFLDHECRYSIGVENPSDQGTPEDDEA